MLSAIGDWNKTELRTRKLKAQIIDDAGFDRTVTRLAHEILERNKGAGTIELGCGCRPSQPESEMKDLGAQFLDSAVAAH